MTANYGIKISQPGFDVGTASNINLVMNSGLNTLKHYTTGILSVTIPGSSAVSTLIAGTFNHNLGYVPAFMVYPNDGVFSTTLNHKPPDYSSLESTGTRLIDQFEFGATGYGTSDLIMFARTYDTGGTPKYWGTANNPQYTINFKYYIFTQQMS